MIIGALDIGTTKVCAVIAETRPDDRELVITGVGEVSSNGVRGGVITDMAAVAKCIQEATEIAMQQAGHAPPDFYVSVSGKHISSYNSRKAIAIVNHNGRITEMDVQRVYEQSQSGPLPADRVMIHAIPRYFRIDGQDGTHQPVGMAAQRLEIETHIVSANAAIIQNVSSSIAQCQLRESDLVLGAIASGVSVLSEKERVNGVWLLDIGGGVTDLAIYQDGVICYSAVIPIGGQHFTNDLAAGLTLSNEEAERVKLKAGVASSEMIDPEEAVDIQQIGHSEKRQVKRSAVALVLEARAEDLFDEVQKRVSQFFDKQPSNGNPISPIPASGIVMTGGGARLTGLVEYACQFFKAQVRLGAPSPLLGLGNSLVSPAYSTAVGLIQFGYNDLVNAQAVRRTLPGRVGEQPWIKKIKPMVSRLIDHFRT